MADPKEPESKEEDAYSSDSLWGSEASNGDSPEQTSLTRKQLREKRLQVEVEEAMQDLREVSRKAQLLGPRYYDPPPVWQSRLRIYRYMLRRMLDESWYVLVWWAFLAGCSIVLMVKVFITE